MPEGLNVEVAHTLTEKDESAARRKHRWEEVVEVIEVLVLSLAAIATAWSGFQASQWDDRQGLSYGQATTERFAASAVSPLGGQQLAADTAMFSSWLVARSAGNTDLEMVFVRRFTPDYRHAFDNWLKTDPLDNASAPPGPAYMPGYRNPNLEKAQELNAEAAARFTEGTRRVRRRASTFGSPYCLRLSCSSLPPVSGSDNGSSGSVPMSWRFACLATHSSI